MSPGAYDRCTARPVDFAGRLARCDIHETHRAQVTWFPVGVVTTGAKAQTSSHIDFRSA
jgi:hypothetical protein